MTFLTKIYIMKSIFNLKFIVLLAIASAFLMSCEKDDDDDDGGSNSIVFDGTSYSIKDGLISDYGAYDTHWNYDFVLVNAALTEVTEDGYTYFDAPEATFYVYAELFSPGTSSFQTGTFQYMSYDASAEDVDGKYYFYDVTVGTRNADGTNEMDYEATAGTVKVTGSGSNYTIEFDVTVEGGKTVKGSYSGTFKTEDETEGSDLLKKK